MSLLISQNGEIFGNDVLINQRIFPVQVGKFRISDDANKFIMTSLDESNAEKLFQFIPQKMDQFCRNEKRLIPTKASVFKRQPEDASQKRSESSQTPHINEGNEVHFFFGGSYRMYFNINDHHYSLIVQAGDWLYIPAHVEHWIKPTQDNYLIIVSYHSEPFDVFHTKVTYTNTKSKAFI